MTAPVSSLFGNPGFHLLSSDRPLLKETATLLESFAKESPDLYRRTFVIVPTRRAVKELQNLLQGTDRALILPRIEAVNDIDSTFAYATMPLAQKDKGNLFQPLPPQKVLSEHQRLGLILTILQAFSKEKLLSEPPSFSFARRLAQFLDDVATFEVKIDHFEDLVPIELAMHWQKTVDFLIPFFKAYKARLTEDATQDQATERINTFRALAQTWNQSPPETPVICAGLDGFIPALFDLSRCIESLPLGYVLCSHATNFNYYSQDRELSQNHTKNDIKASLKPTHPDALIQKLSPITPQAKDGRTLLLTQIFADQVTDFHPINNVFIYEADTLAKEALCAALLARQAIADYPRDEQIIIVVPDPDLGLKIDCELSRWNIIADLAGGTPLSAHRLGLLTLDILNYAGNPDQDLALFTVLKNPYVCLGATTHPEYKTAVRTFETQFRRTGKLNPEALPPFVSTFRKLCLPLIQQPKKPLDYWMTTHQEILHQLTGKTDRINPEVAQALQNIFHSLAETTAYFPPLGLQEYKDLMQKSLSDALLRNPVAHKRIRILNPIQALYAPKDIAILAGLNEGMWPAPSPENPWLNRNMAIKMGLYDPQILVGRAASLFAGCLGKEKSYLLYSKQKEGAPQTPSRFILRLKAYAEQTRQTQRLVPDVPLDALIGAVNHLPEGPKACLRITEPRPLPAIDQRPIRFSISDLEVLLKNPYHICVKYIYRLHVLPSFDQVEAQKTYGSFVHKILEEAGHLGDYSQESLLRLAQAIVPFDISLKTRFVWFHQFKKSAAWLSTFLLNRQTGIRHSLYEHFMSHVIHIDSPFGSQSRGQAIEIVGKADRIDDFKDNTIEILDYKTGHIPSIKAVKDFQAPQLSLLAWLYQKTAHKQPDRLTYVDIANEKSISVDTKTLTTDIEQKIRELLTPYLDPTMPYLINPAESLRNPFNPYQHLERTEEWLAQKL